MPQRERRRVQARQPEREPKGQREPAAGAAGARRRRADRSGSLERSLARVAEDGDRLTELHLAARGDQELQQRPLVEGAELHRRLVGLDLGEEVVDR